MSTRFWKHQTRLGNRRFALGNHAGALACYQQALWSARQHLPLWREPEEAVAALVVSYHNLADLLLAMALPERAAHYLCEAQQSLLNLLQDGAQPCRLREAAHTHLSCCRVELLRFLRRSGPHPEVEQALRRCGCAHPTLH
ncbi:DUF2753 family protein [Aeromonas simiae]|uniref:DUF2753 family protein n=1 Tax=Aeromonas simiae TaxID=218936 RepID=A0A5J6WW53_9GAMM|nr:DUF2753 family protein [Aeromonas simiae]QFI54534.1 DUF2753 family protein [Aeromonas simiae]